MLLEPDFLVADELVSTLDVSVRAGIINQSLHFRDRFGMAILFITHDLAVARYVADRIAGMQFGKFVEVEEAKQVISNPQHACSRELLANMLPVGNE
jgi:ABC-type oligopeptide transport system ATPase subunit